jgi:bifunctional DNase/RNase
MRIRKKKRDRQMLFTVIALAALLIAANHITLHIMQCVPMDISLPESALPVLSHPSVEGYEEAEIEAGLDTVLLTVNCTTMTMTTNPYQAASIQYGIDGTVDVRPTTHDTLSDILDAYWIDPLYVRIDKMEDGTYFSKLVLRSGDRILTLDTRPTDAIGVAVRFGAPVYVKRELLETYGEGTC